MKNKIILDEKSLDWLIGTRKKSKIKQVLSKDKLYNTLIKLKYEHSSMVEYRSPKPQI